MSLPAVARARWGRSRCRGHGSPSAWLGAPVCGVRAVALAPDSRADFLLKFFRCRRGKVIEIDAEVRAARPTPALARAQRPRPHAGPIPHACPALRLPSARISPPPRPLRPSHAHAAPPRTSPARRPRRAPARWAHALVGGASGSYPEGSCRTRRQRARGSKGCASACSSAHPPHCRRRRRNSRAGRGRRRRRDDRRRRR